MVLLRWTEHGVAHYFTDSFRFVSPRVTPNWLGIVVPLLLYICFLSIFPAASLRFLCRSIDDEMTCKTSMPTVCVFSLDL